MSLLATLLANPVHLHRVRVALRDEHTLVPCDDWAALSLICESRPVRAVILDIYAMGPGSLERIRGFKRRFPTIAVVAYVTVTAERARDMFEAGRIGIDALVVADVTDAPQPLAAAIEQAERRSVAATLVRQLGASADPVIREAVTAAITRAHEGLTPETLARRVAVPRRVLSKRLIEQGFPPPHQLLTWGRLIAAAQMLEEPKRTADAVAHALEFPSGSAFRNICHRYVGATPQQIRARGGAAYVLRVFSEQRGWHRLVELDADERQQE
jgi:AraC-like DNA-binding protein